MEEAGKHYKNKPTYQEKKKHAKLNAEFLNSNNGVGPSEEMLETWQKESFSHFFYTNFK